MNDPYSPPTGGNPEDGLAVFHFPTTLNEVATPLQPHSPPAEDCPSIGPDVFQLLGSSSAMTVGDDDAVCATSPKVAPPSAVPSPQATTPLTPDPVVTAMPDTPLEEVVPLTEAALGCPRSRGSLVIQWPPITDDEPSNTDTESSPLERSLSPSRVAAVQSARQRDERPITLPAQRGKEVIQLKSTKETSSTQTRSVEGGPGTNGNRKCSPSPSSKTCDPSPDPSVVPPESAPESATKVAAEEDDAKIITTVPNLQDRISIYGGRKSKKIPAAVYRPPPKIDIYATQVRPHPRDRPPSEQHDKEAKKSQLIDSFPVAAKDSVRDRLGLKPDAAVPSSVQNKATPSQTQTSSLADKFLSQIQGSQPSTRDSAFVSVAPKVAPPTTSDKEKLPVLDIVTTSKFKGGGDDDTSIGMSSVSGDEFGKVAQVAFPSQRTGRRNFAGNEIQQPTRNRVAAYHSTFQTASQTHNNVTPLPDVAMAKLVDEIVVQRVGELKRQWEADHRRQWQALEDKWNRSYEDLHAKIVDTNRRLDKLV